MTQQRGPDHKALKHFVAKAPEHTLRAYVGSMDHSNRSLLDSFLLAIIMALLDRLFPKERPQEPTVVSQGNEPPF